MVIFFSQPYLNLITSIILTINQNTGTLLNVCFRRSYYLLVAITQEGFLKFEEDREDSTFGAEVKNTNFLNGTEE